MLLILSVLAWFFLVALPVALLVLLRLGDTPLDVAAHLLEGVGGLADGSFVPTLRGAAIAAAVVMLLGAWGPTRAVFGRRSARTGPVRLWGRRGAGALIIAAAVLGGLAWGGDSALYGAVAAVPVAAVVLLAGLALGLVLLGVALAVAVGIYLFARPRPFAAGLVVATLAMMSAMSVWAAVRTIDANSMAALAADLAALPKSTPWTEELRELLRARADRSKGPALPVFASLDGIPPSQAPSTTERCFERLSTKPPTGTAEWQKQIDFVERQYRFDGQTAYDVVMKTLATFCASEAVEHYDNLPAAFTTAVRNEANYEARRRSRMLIGLDEDAMLFIYYACSYDAADDVRLATEIETAERAWETLDGLTQEAIALKIQGYSVHEIAQRQGSSDEQTRNRISNGMKKVRNRVRRGCYGG